MQVHVPNLEQALSRPTQLLPEHLFDNNRYDQNQRMAAASDHVENGDLQWTNEAELEINGHSNSSSRKSSLHSRPQSSRTATPVSTTMEEYFVENVKQSLFLYK